MYHFIVKMHLKRNIFETLMATPLGLTFLLLLTWSADIQNAA